MRLVKITEEIDAAIIAPQLSKDRKVRIRCTLIGDTRPLQYHLESLFRSVHYALVEHASHAYVFITDFFMHDRTTATNTFNAVMTRSMDVVKVRILACTRDARTEGYLQTHSHML
jgi:hypothetical protein